MNQSPLYPQLRHQLDSVLPAEGIEAIDKICHDFTVTNQSNVTGIFQPAGTCLMFYLENSCEGSQLRILPFLVPSTMQTAKMMEADSTSNPSDFLESIEQMGFYRIGCHLLRQSLVSGASIQQFVKRRNELVRNNLVDAMLVIKSGKSDQLNFLELYIGERLLPGN
jgi:hypothetical protein